MSKLKTLIFDTDQEAFKSLASRLEARGWEAVFCANLDEGIKALKGSPSLALVECFMPIQDGFEIARQLLNKKANLKVIMTSHIVSFESFQESTKSDPSITTFIPKPISDQDLDACLQEFKTPSCKPKTVPFYFSNPSFKDLSLHLSKNNSLDALQISFFLLKCAALGLNGQVHLQATHSNQSLVLGFFEGQIYKALSSQKDHSLGETLVSLGFLLREDLDQYLKSPNPELKIGEALCKQNLISPHAINEALKAQIKNRINKILSFNTFKMQISEHPNTSNTAPSPLFSLQSLANVVFEQGSNMIKNAPSSDFFKHALESVPLQETPLWNLFSEEALFTSYYKHELLNQSSYNSKDLSLLFVLFASGAIETISPPDLSSPLESDFKQNLQQLKQQLKSDHPFEKLGLDSSSTNWSDAQIAKQYHRVAKAVHPDVMGSKKLPEVLKQEAEEIFKLLTETFNLVKTSEKRLSFEAFTKNQTSRQASFRQQEFELSKKHLEQGAFSRAHESLSGLVEFQNEFEDFSIYFLWAYLKTQNENPEESLLNEHSQKAHGSNHAHLELFVKALLAKARGDLTLFQTYIKKSIEAQPHFLPARRELVLAKNELIHKTVKKSEASNQNFSLGQWFKKRS